MPKAKPLLNQLGFDFEVPMAPSYRCPATAGTRAALAGLEQRINEIVGTILNSDPRSREVIAAEMSVILGEDVSARMLDAYASPARTEHKVPFSRLLALVAVTDRQDMLDPPVREVGAAVLIGEEVKTARIGHLERVIAEALAEKKQLAGAARPIRRGGNNGRSSR